MIALQWTVVAFERYFLEIAMQEQSEKSYGCLYKSMFYKEFKLNLDKKVLLLFIKF